MFTTRCFLRLLQQLLLLMLMLLLLLMLMPPLMPLLLLLLPPPLLLLLRLPTLRSGALPSTSPASRPQALLPSAAALPRLAALPHSLPQVKCEVQPFSSAKNRLHCVLGAGGTPTPTWQYHPAGAFVSIPLRVYKSSGRVADCWQLGGLNDLCYVRYDVGGTPRVRRLATPVVESGGVLRIVGDGIDGGLSGAPRLKANLYRGTTPVLGACGEKDCQASNMGAETLGCYSRPDAGGDGVSGLTQASQLATVFSDASSFGCVLDQVCCRPPCVHLALPTHPIHRPPTSTHHSSPSNIHAPFIALQHPRTVHRPTHRSTPLSYPPRSPVHPTPPHPTRPSPSQLSGGLSGGFFNVSLHAISDPKHRGDAYLGFMATR